MTLVELMVAMAIGLFMTAVAGAMFLATKTGFTAQENDSRIQEKARFVLATLAEDLRMSGFRGCRAPTANNPSVPPSNTFTNLLATPSEIRYDYLSPIWSSRQVGTLWSPAMPAEYSGLAASDTLLVVRRPVDAAWSILADMPVRSSDLQVQATTGFAVGDILLLADCIGAVVFQATSDASAGVIRHAIGGGVTPGNASADLPRTFAQDAVIWRMQTRAYYLAPSAMRPGSKALWVNRWPVYPGESRNSELATGVERLSVSIGIDTNGDDAADTYVQPSSVADWGLAVTAKLQMLMVGDAATAVSSDPIVFDGQMIDMSDKKPRVVLHALASLRNRLP